MDPAPLFPLAGEKATNPTALFPLGGESKADLAICHPSRFQSDPFARQGMAVHLPLMKGEAGRGCMCGPSEGPVCKFALKFARKPLDI